tara:strand:- start:89 stop:835 length:747 start_codon:yes stop_codon:yes gene_type:complete
MSARSYTTRRLKSASGADIKNSKGKYIRVKIHKENRAVLKVKEENWTNEAHARYTELFPNNIDVKKPRKNKVKTASPAPEVPLLPIEEEEKDDCCICCSELPKATTTLECGHTFCTGCILTWFKRKNNCPMCRAEVKEAPSPTASVGRVHIDYHHACDILDLTNRVLNGESLHLTSAFTNTRVGFTDIQNEYRTRMLRRSSRQMGRGGSATRPNGHRFVEAFVEVVNRLSANVDDGQYNNYFTSNGNH